MHVRGKAQPSQFAARSTQDCEAICIETIQYCLEIGGAHAAPRHIQLLQDCADICETTAKFVLRASAQHDGVASACADICELCAASCETFAGDPQMKACANQCYLCASACRQMVSGTAGRQFSPGAAGRAEAGQGASHSGAR